MEHMYIYKFKDTVIYDEQGNIPLTFNTKGEIKS